VLLDAAFRGHVELFDFLLSKGADPHFRDNLGKTVHEYIKTDYADLTKAPKTQGIKDKLSQIFYRYTLSRPFKTMAPNKGGVGGSQLAL
jgi:hypothetical protein